MAAMPGSFRIRSPMPRNCGGSASSSSHRDLRAAMAASILRNTAPPARQGCGSSRDSNQALLGPDTHRGEG